MEQDDKQRVITDSPSARGFNIKVTGFPNWLTVLSKSVSPYLLMPTRTLLVIIWKTGMTANEHLPGLLILISVYLFFVLGLCHLEKHGKTNIESPSRSEGEVT